MDVNINSVLDVVMELLELCLNIENVVVKCIGFF